MRYAITLVAMVAIFIVGRWVDTRASLALLVFAALALVVLEVRKK